MGEVRQNWLFRDDIEKTDQTNQNANQSAQHDAPIEPTYESFKEHFDEFKAWAEYEARCTKPLRPRGDEEKTVFTCPGWRVYSPRWDEEEALHNKKIKQWEAIIIFSKPQSYAWVEDHFPRSAIGPLRVSDRRQAESRLVNYRERTKGMRRKDSYTPTHKDLGSIGEGEVL